MKSISQLKCLIVGVGSIGRRHLRNLRSLGVQEFILHRRAGYDANDTELAGAIVETDLATALAHQPDVAIVANPTSLHLATALACVQAGCHLFLEKPISHTLHGCEALLREVNARQVTAMVGFQFRFHPGLMRVRELLSENAIGAVVSVQAHWGEYLPAWHPWEDHRQSYSARADLGGGVALTLCHPFDYLRWLLGEVQEVSAMTGQRGGLGIETEDTLDAQLLFASGALAQVHLDYVQRPPHHTLQLIGQQGTLHWDNETGAVRLFTAQHGAWQEFAAPPQFERNTMFVEEMRHFLHCLTTGQTPCCTLADGLAALRLAVLAKDAATQKRTLRKAIAAAQGKGRNV
ncbi:MAG: Gfo/Idh/MocA family oxidoreductase [Blastocatellia bacterium]